MSTRAGSDYRKKMVDNTIRLDNTGGSFYNTQWTPRDKTHREISVVEWMVFLTTNDAKRSSCSGSTTSYKHAVIPKFNNPYCDKDRQLAMGAR